MTRTPVVTDAMSDQQAADALLERALAHYARAHGHLLNALGFQRQLGLSDAEIANKTGLPVEDVENFLEFWESLPEAN
jgi:hypothetical protein